MTAKTLVRNLLVARNSKRLPALLSVAGRIRKEDEIIRIGHFAQKYPREMIPYDWALAYAKLEVVAAVDKDLGLPFAVVDQKRFYFPEDFTLDQVVNAVRIGLKEQDPRSPHRYSHGITWPQLGGVAILVGASDCLFARSLETFFDKIILVECMSRWITPMRATIGNHTGKYEIIEATIGAPGQANTKTLDSIINGREKEVRFVQADIEGAEIQLLLGAENMLKVSGDIALSVCTYHTQQQCAEVIDFLEARGFSCSKSPGYINPLTAKPLSYPYIRTGVVYAKKTSQSQEFVASATI